MDLVIEWRGDQISPHLAVHWFHTHATDSGTLPFWIKHGRRRKTVLDL